MFEVSRGTKYFDKQVDYPKTRVFCGQNIRINPDDAYILFSGESEVECDKGDKFNGGFGFALASVNAEIAMLEEYKKALISLTKQPEWKKIFKTEWIISELTNSEKELIQSVRNIRKEFLKDK